MYLICKKSTLPNFDAAHAIRHAVSWGTLSAPSQSWEVYATFPNRDRAVNYAKTLANEIGEEVEVRSAYADGDHYSIGVYAPTPTPIEEQEKYDGVPADTGSV
jgi:hypothetical protein